MPSCPRCRLPTQPDLPAPAPPVKWAQRPDVVLITIPLRDISEEQLSVSERKLSIRWGWGRVGRGGVGRAQLSCASCCCCMAIQTSPPSSLEGRRNSAALVRIYVSQKAAGKDRALMDFLGLDQSRIQKHYANHPRNIVEAVQAALMEWAGSSPSKTWKMLVDAMKQAEFAVQEVRGLTEELQKGTCANVLCVCIF